MLLVALVKGRFEPLNCPSMRKRIVQMVPFDSCSHKEGFFVLFGVTLINLKSPVGIDNFPADNVRCHTVCLLFGSNLAFWTYGLEKFLGWYRRY